MNEEADTIALYELARQRSVVRDRVRDVAARRQTSTYVFGPAGTGKTSMARAALDDIEEPYHYHAGHLTAMGYFDLLRKHRDDVIILDDVGSLFRDKIGQQLLLASLGTPSPGESARVIRYQRRGKDEEVVFEGGLIALSNIRLHDNDEVMVAIKSGTKPVCWDPTDVQLVAMMRDAVANGWDCHGISLSPAECLETVEFLVSTCRQHSARLDLRLLFEGALPDRAATKAGEHEADWRDHTRIAVQEQVRRLEFTGPPQTRDQRIEIERKIVERIRASHSTRQEQVAAWSAETKKSERAFDRRSAELRIAK